MVTQEPSKPEGSKPERSTADWYRTFGEVEARGQSAIFEEWALGVADDAELVALIDTLPLQKRQPNLVFATARLLGVPDGSYPAFRTWMLTEWQRLAAEIQHRMTQTNEPRRCTALLPALALATAGNAAPGAAALEEGAPIALLELGASAGLCLYPDHYSYRYLGKNGRGEWLHPSAGPSEVRLEAETIGPVPVPDRLPNIVWRGGIDLHPLDLRDEDDARWLHTLVWPEQHERRARVKAAAALVQSDPPHLVTGNAIDELAALAATVPRDATLVILTSVMLVYLPYLERMELVEAIRALDAQWISIDMVGVLPTVDAQLDDPRPGQFTLSLNGAPLAAVGPHGQFLNWPEPVQGQAQ